MFKILDRFLNVAIVIAAVLCLGVVGVALADDNTPTVVLNGEDFTLENVNPGTTDLFKNLKDLMPGDQAEQQIKVEARNIKGEWEIFVFAQKCDNSQQAKDYVTLMSAEKNGKKLVTLTATASDGTNLSDLTVIPKTESEILIPNDCISLGEFSSGTKKTIDLDLLIDIEAGNELKNLTAAVDWIFYAVQTDIGEIPTPPGPGPGVGPSEPPILNYEDHISYVAGYPDGMVHPEWNITRAEIATIFYRLMDKTALEKIWSMETIYPDVQPGDWYYMFVSTLSTGGMMSGYPDGTFRPDAPITRAELATVICQFDSQFGKIQSTLTFPDIQGHWAQEYIEFNELRGYVSGYPDGTFRPDAPITRAEAVTMINRLLHRIVDAEGLEGVAHIKNGPGNQPGAWYY